jgi:putative DNA primase/helicase
VDAKADRGAVIMMSTLDTALMYAHAGLSVIPVRLDGSKVAAVKWAEYQTRIASDEELRHLFSNGAGIAIVAGSVSGHLEILDFESEAPFHQWLSLVDTHESELASALVIINTPSGGHHVAYRCMSGIERNQKLAMRFDGNTAKVMIETRGEGGYVLTVGCPPSCHPARRPYTLLQGDLVPGHGERCIPSITADERCLLIDAARTFNEVTKQQKEAHGRSTGGIRPGDVFAQHVRWDEILIPRDWTIAGTLGEETLWRRPGKEHGWSATTNYRGSDRLYVFSTNAPPFEHNTCYTKFGAYAFLEHGGDFKAAASTIAQRFQLRLRDSDDHEDTAPPPVQYSDDALADVFSERHKDNFRYADEWGWLQWSGTHWCRVPDVVVMGYARQICREQSKACKNDPDVHLNIRARLARVLASAKTVAAVVKLASTDARHYIEVSRFDTNLWAFNTPGGTIDVKTGIVHSHRREDYVTKIAKATPRGDCPKWLAFLNRVTSGNLELHGLPSTPRGLRSGWRSSGRMS